MWANNGNEKGHTGGRYSISVERYNEELPDMQEGPKPKTVGLYASAGTSAKQQAKRRTKYLTALKKRIEDALVTVGKKLQEAEATEWELNKT